MSRFKLVLVLLFTASAVLACGDDDDGGGSEGASGTELNCELGREITADFAEIRAQAGAPTVEQFEEIRSKVEEFGKPDGISDEVDDVLDTIDVFIEELGKGDDFDQEALGAAAEKSSGAGDAIEAHLDENCD